MSDQAKLMPGGAPKYHVDVSGEARVGIIGDYGIVNMVTPRRQITWPVAVGSPPPLASAFQPRTSILEQLDQAESTVVLRQVMAGDGGVGKSQIATGIYHSSQADLRLWVAAESPAAVIAGYAEASVRLDLADADERPEQLAKLFLRFLEATDKECLVILDDLADPADMARLWPAGGARVIVTTRRRDAALTGGGRTMIDVGVYTDVEAEDYLDQRLGNRLLKGGLEQSGDLAADLGYLPLGLSHAAAVIIDQAISCAEYRTRFADRARSLEELFPAEADVDGYGKIVATTWALAIDAANKLAPAGLAAPMAFLVAVLDPAGAPEAVCNSRTARTYLAHMTQEEEEEEVSAALARGALRALHRLSLITHDPDPTAPRAVRMHNLTGRAVLQTVDAEHVASLVRVAADALAESWPDVESSPALAEALRANTATLSALGSNALCDQGTGVHPVLLRSGLSLIGIGLIAQAIAYFSDLCNQTEQVLGPDHPGTLASRINLAYAYESAGDLGRAIPLCEQNLTDCERILGPDHPDTLTLRNNLAYAYRSAEDLGRAIPLFEQTLQDRLRVQGPHHPNTMRSRDNLAGAYRNAGDLGQAIPLYEQTLADRERILGRDHPDTLSSRNDLGTAYKVAGDLGRAIPMLEQALADRERIFGRDQPQTLISRSDLALAYESAGDTGRAIPMLEQTLADRVRVLGPDHPQTLTSRNNLAYAYESVGDTGRAIQLFEQTLADRERILGPDHPDTLISRSNLANAYESAGDLDRAIQLYEQTLADSQRVLRPDHPNALTLRNNLANAYQAAGRLEEAAALYNEGPSTER